MGRDRQGLEAFFPRLVPVFVRNDFCLEPRFSLIRSEAGEFRKVFCDFSQLFVGVGAIFQVADNQFLGGIGCRYRDLFDSAGLLRR